MRAPTLWALSMLTVLAGGCECDPGPGGRGPAEGARGGDGQVLAPGREGLSEARRLHAVLHATEGRSEDGEVGSREQVRDELRAAAGRSGVLAVLDEPPREGGGVSAAEALRRVGRVLEAASPSVEGDAPGPRGIDVPDRAVVDLSADDGSRLRVDLLSIELEGELDPSAVEAGARRGLEDVRGCYRRALALRPGLGGRLEMRLELGPDGRVEREGLGDDGVGDRGLARCALAAASGWSFPEGAAGAVTLTIELVPAGQ